MATFIDGPLHGRTVQHASSSHLVLIERPDQDEIPLLVSDAGSQHGDCYSRDKDGNYRYTGTR